MQRSIVYLYTFIVYNKWMTYRNWDFVDVAKVRGSYEGWRHVLRIDYINSYGGCRGQYLVPPFIFSTPILRKQINKSKPDTIDQG